MAVKPTTYCEAINFMKPGDRELHQQYHDHLYGFPIEDDNELFCRLVLEINQAGLSWTTILKKEANFRLAYDAFNIQKVAAYTQTDIDRLMADAGIIRNRLKVHAAIENAAIILRIQQEFGSFKNWLNIQHPLSREAWTNLFKKNFRFTGGKIVSEFLVSTGYLPGAHDEYCKVYKKVIQSKPTWYAQ